MEEKKRLKKTLLGNYKKDSVDICFNDLTERMLKAQKENKEIGEEVEKLRVEVGNYEKEKELMVELLLDTKKYTTGLKEKAECEYESMLQKAQDDVDSIIREGKEMYNREKEKQDQLIQELIRKREKIEKENSELVSKLKKEVEYYLKMFQSGVLNSDNLKKMFDEEEIEDKNISNHKVLRLDDENELVQTHEWRDKSGRRIKVILPASKDEDLPILNFKLS